MDLHLDGFDATAAASLLGSPEEMPDRRLVARLRKTIHSLAFRLGAMPMKEGRARRRGTQRLYDNKRLRGATLLRRLRENVCASLPDDELVIAHDTSECDKHGRGCPEDAGPLRSCNSCGYLIHVAVACTPPALLPVGVVDAWAWTRSWTQAEKSRKHRPMVDKESCKWDRGVEHAEHAMRQAGRHGPFWHVEDREADIYEHLANQKRKGRRLVVRVDLPGRARMVRDATGSRVIAIETKLQSLPWRCRYQVKTVERGDATLQGRAAVQRTATVACRYARVMLEPPKHYKGRQDRHGLELWVVEAKEQGAPAGVEPLHWVLWSLVPVETDETALAIVRTFSGRWGAEVFFRAAKNGCGLEAQHVDDLASFKRVMAVTMATTTHLMQMLNLSRETPNLPARPLFTEGQIKATKETASYHRLPWPTGRLTLSNLLTVIARIGGYEPNARDRFGLLVLTRGWQRVQEYQSIARHALRRQERDSTEPPDS